MRTFLVEHQVGKVTVTEPFRVLDWVAAEQLAEALDGQVLGEDFTSEGLVVSERVVDALLSEPM